MQRRKGVILAFVDSGSRTGKTQRSKLFLASVASRKEEGEEAAPGKRRRNPSAVSLGYLRKKWGLKRWGRN